MQPISLKLTAFGPFSASHIVDFSSLQDAIFLINGATGAGKSTLLDAICFALYGETTGGERQANQLRCDLSDDSLVSSVEFEFGLKGERYKVIRLPTQQKPKSRGDGFTVLQTEGQFWRTTNEPELLVPKKATEITAQVKTLLGLSAEQFRQVMVLPQGQFRKLLMADSKEREAIFSQLFQTQIYKRIEEQLSQEAQSVIQAKQHQDEQIKGVLMTAEVDSMEQLQQQLRTLHPQVTELTTQVEQSQNQLLVFKQQHAEQQKRAELEQSLRVHKQQQEELASQQSDIEHLQQALKQASLAQPIMQLLEQQQANQDRVSLVNSQLASAQAAESQGQNALEGAMAELVVHQQAQTQQDERKQGLAALEQFKTKFAEITGFEQHIQQASQQRNQLEEKRAKLAQQHTNLVAQREQLSTQSSQLKSSLLDASQLTLRLTQCQQLLTLFTEYDQLNANKIKFEQQREQLREQFQQQRVLSLEHENQYLALESKFFQQQAAQLAQSLLAGEPCIVCGSLDHPNPCQSSDGLVSKTQLDEAKNISMASQNQLQEIKQQGIAVATNLETIEQQIVQLHAQLEGQDSKLLVNEYNELEVQIKVNAQNEKHVQQLEQQLQNVQKQLDDTAVLLQQSEQQCYGVENELAVLKQRLLEAQKARPQGIESEAELHVKVAQLKQQISDYEQVGERIRLGVQNAQNDISTHKESAKQLNQQLLQLQSDAANLTAKLDQQLAQSTFTQLAAVKEAALEDAQQTIFQQKIDDYVSAVASNKTAIAQVEQWLADIAPLEVEKLNTDMQTLEQELQQQKLSLQNAHSRFTHLQQADKNLNKLTAANEALEQEYKLVGTLAEVANGKNPLRLSLQRFVLSVLLDDVLQQASMRMQKMSKGRYTLLRKLDKAKGNKSSGLEMLVEDGYTGKCREVATLSGGESFIAALSLALGLADVVQSYAGGIKLDTLFIDEGFGSLDQEALDLAMRTLTDLQSKGRTIGIISHVSELKEQISKRIDVQSSRFGSEIVINA